ncbi:MAG: 4Fe-4S dicluster domain-containing protein [Desulfovibrionales bacterium]
MKILPMTMTLVRNLVQGHGTRLYPGEKRETFDDVRGDLAIDIDRCISCGICQRICPSFCLEVDKQARTWAYEPFACVFCGNCVEKCPTDCLSMGKQFRPATDLRARIVLQAPERKPSEK